MSSVVISGNTSGTVTLSAQDVAGATTITLPTSNGTMALTTNYLPGSLIRAPQVLTSGTSYTTPSNCEFIYVELVGGGGKGATGGTGTGAGGGGGGGYAAKYFNVSPSTAYTYAVGAANGNTTFTVGGTTVTASAGSNGASLVGGAGGTGTNGDINISGQDGSPGTATGLNFGGMGGSSPRGYGIGAQPVLNSGAGRGGFGYGAGSSGSCNNGGAPPNGTQGIVIVWEYA